MVLARCLQGGNLAERRAFALPPLGSPHAPCGLPRAARDRGCTGAGGESLCLPATPPFKIHLDRFETIEWPDCRANIDIAGIVGPVMGFFPGGPG